MIEYYFYKFKYLLWKIKDYDRLQYDYIRVLEHATLGNMSKSNYDVETILKVIDDQQYKYCGEMIKSDIKDILNESITASESIIEIEDYLNKL